MHVGGNAAVNASGNAAINAGGNAAAAMPHDLRLRKKTKSNNAKDVTAALQLEKYEKYAEAKILGKSTTCEKK